MEHVSKSITQPSAKSEQPINEPVMLSDEQMRQVWERMTMMYGHRWKSNYGTEDDGTWRKGLAGLLPVQIGVGLVKCLERKPKPGEEDWPPTLSEFRAMCLPPKTDPSHREWIALPKPETNPSVIENNLQEMKRILK